MIQRKQSLFILAAIVLLLLLIVLPIETFGSMRGMVELHWNCVTDVTPHTTHPIIRKLHALAFIIMLPLVLNVVGLFLFKVRPVQMRLIGIAAGIELCLTAVLIYLSISVADGIQAEWHVNLRWLMPLAASAMDLLAYRRISDDEALVNSFSRLRK